MRRYVLFFVLTGAAAFGAATPSTLITNVYGRHTVSLNGSWRVIVDPYHEGESLRVYRNEKPASPSDMVQYSFDASPVMKVPGDWNTQSEQWMFYEGPMWFRRDFRYQKKAGTRVFVYFGAANYRTSVYLNGEKLGDHEGGFTPFNFEATSSLKDGENFLVAEVDNARHADAVPALKYDWWNYGGITADVMLIEVPQTFIQDYWVQLTHGSQDEISGWVQLNGAAAGQRVEVEIPEAGVRQSAVADTSRRANFHFRVKLELWTPEKPKLYDVVLRAGDDTIHDQIGFRTIEVQGNKILLNGKPIFLRGISMHEEAPFRDGRAFSTEDSQTLLGWAKELACNFVRFAHYPHSEHEVRLADRMGLLVWSEIPVYWDIDWTNPATLANAEAQLRDMIARDHNRAAVMLWSVSNETPVKPERTTFLKQLVQDAHEMDATRLVTSALNHVDHAGDVRELNDPLGDVLDVIGLNEYVGWYEGPPEDCDRLQWKMKWNKPLIVSEFGAGALYGRHGDKDERWTEEYQQNVFDHQLAMVQRMPNLVGLTPWVLMDFRTPLRMLPGVQDYHNRKGVVSNRGERKLAFYTLQEFYKGAAKNH